MDIAAIHWSGRWEQWGLRIKKDASACWAIEHTEISIDNTNILRSTGS